MDMNYAGTVNGGMAYGNGGYSPYMAAQFYGANPMVYNTVPMPQNQNALTEDEIKRITTTKPSKLDITVPEDEIIRSMCTHKHNGRDVVVLTNDANHTTCYCPICGKTWKDRTYTKEEVQELVYDLISAMQHAKWVADFPIQLVREYFAMIPILEKFPDLYEYAMKNFNRYMTQNGYTTASDASAYARYNAVWGGGNNFVANPYPTHPTYPIQPQQPAGYYGQQQQVPGYAPAAVQAQQPGYYTGAPANPMTNPMQVQQPMDYYNQQPQMIPQGINPAAPSPFVNQANMMMAGGVPYPQAQPQQPQFAPATTYAPAAQQAQQPAPAVNQQVSTPPVNDGQTAKSETKVKL